MAANASLISRMNTAMRANAHTRLSATWARWYRRAHGVRQANRLCLDSQMHWVVERWTQWKLLATHTLRINNALVRGAQYFVHKKLSARFGEWATEARAGGTGLLAMRCADDRLLSSLEHSFRLWRQRASTLVTVHCTSVQLLRQSAARAMRTWVAVASARARAARLAHRAVARMVSQQLAAGLSCWANRADETRHRREMMSHGLSRMASRALSTVLASWVWRIDCLAEMQRQLQGAVSQVARGRQLSALRLWRAEACALFSARALAARWMLASSKCALAVWKSVATEWMQTHERAQVAAALMLNRHLLAHWTQWKLHAAITLRTRAALVRGAQYWVQQRLSARFEAWATEARAGAAEAECGACDEDLGGGRICPRSRGAPGSQSRGSHGFSAIGRRALMLGEPCRRDAPSPRDDEPRLEPNGKSRAFHRLGVVGVEDRLSR
ncbi:hypothetical protein AB1Y20_007023 [Prymnesium parvum]|uniref:Sfi1 spindle body domain-containing protein n=1 Tax=Prymnesium parvum TaxID=97485 RepID=A0AB34J1K9_PRYPA